MHSLRFFGTCLLLGGLAWTSPVMADAPSNDGIAQDDEGEDSDDVDMSDIIDGGDGEETPEQEARGLQDGTGEIELIEDDGKKGRIIKIIQRKSFSKKGRFEASPHIAFVANDPFLNRYIVGSGLNYNITEIFAIEANLDFSPDLDEADWKPLTKQLIEENHVSPDISKLTLFGNVNFLFSPIYGKIAVVGRKIINFDIYGSFGMGATRTSDDLKALDTTSGDDRAEISQHQTHPTTNFGGGVRVIFGKNVAARLEGRSMVYIETVNATTLEMKNNLILQLSISFFFPAMKS
jgi:outer membrane beta-barrel protein